MIIIDLKELITCRALNIREKDAKSDTVMYIN